MSTTEMPATEMSAAEIAAATPATRARVVDFWRVTALLVVVVGHWLAASIWMRPDGSLELRNALEWLPQGAWVSWLVQVMPVFFLVGGFANARSLRHVADGSLSRHAWTAGRTRRLIAPTLPLLIVWLGLVAVLTPVVDAEVLRAGTMAATVPLWFLAVYVLVTAAAPWTHTWWRRWRLRSVLALAAAAIVVDLVRFGLDVAGVGFVNYLFVWGAVHQLGYWWADRGHRRSVGIGVALSGAALAALLVVTWIGWYPVAMLGFGTGPANVTPPTAALLLLGLVQAGILWGTQPAVTRLTQRRRVWTAVVATSGVMMTLYLWHLSAMAVVAATGLYTAHGAVFRVEPGTARWWLTRPLWILALALVVAACVALFGRVERSRPSPRRPPGRLGQVAGVLLVAASLGVVASNGISVSNGTIGWLPALVAVAGTALLGALPDLRRSASASQPARPRSDHTPMGPAAASSTETTRPGRDTIRHR